MLVEFQRTDALDFPDYFAPQVLLHQVLVVAEKKISVRSRMHFWAAAKEEMI